MIAKNHYKDADTKGTINKIRNILHSIEVMPIEHKWYNLVDGYYSVHLKVPETCLFSNGKGISYEYALASAYGEFMERLQNQIMYKSKVSFSNETNRKYGFKHSPDEIYVTLTDLVCKVKGEFNIYIPPEWDENKLEILFDLCLQLDIYSLNNMLIAIPFYSLTKASIYYIPLIFLDLNYASNGMCSGNSASEALTQGLCEILERNAKYRSLNSTLIAPDIPREYLMHYKKEYEMITNLEKQGKYKIYVKDCSCEFNVPTIAVLVISLENQKYFWSFGSHPVFEVALSRTLSEILQGKDKHDVNFSDFIFKNETHVSKNKLKAFKDGTATYPMDILSNKYTYDFSDAYIRSFSSNDEMLEYVCENLMSKDYDIMLRDVSFLDFPSYQIVVPGLSEVSQFEDVDLSRIVDTNKMQNYILNIPRITTEQLTELLEVLDKHKFDDDEMLGSLIKIPLNDTFYLNNLKIGLFKSMAHYKLKNFEKSFKYISDFVISIASVNQQTYSYYKCARDFIGGISLQYTTEEIKEILEKIYDKKLVDEVVSDLEDPDHVFNYFYSLNCWECDNCVFGNDCKYSLMDNIFCNIKKRYLENSIDQNNIKYIFRDFESLYAQSTR